jgi:hypothetical protein
MTTRDLTPLERIMVAFGHYARGIPQDDLAALMNVNAGRINEACLAIMKAATAPKAIRKYGEKRK